jgi:hypothetical protein
MNRYTLIFFGIILLFKVSYAQKIITLQSGTDLHQYYSLDSAMMNASDGDFIFVPGGIFTVSNFVINKSVMIFGAGHYHDSTMATGESYIIGNVILENGASAGLITGFDIDGDIRVGAAGSDSVSNYTISRCNFNNLLLSANGAAPTNARNFSVSENIIRGDVMGANALNLNLTKNFIEGGLVNFHSAVFQNNNFIGLGNCQTLVVLIQNVTSSNFDNNIFLYTPPACAGAALFDSLSINNVFMNNLFSMSVNFPINSNQAYNTISGHAVNTIFINATGDVFSYSDDYQLKPGSQGLQAGTDGYDIGVFGTVQPFKTASVPFNPHIQSKNFDSITNSQGQLNIQIRVGAQDY